MKHNNNISYVNIRATAQKMFWGDEYEESVYLWEGAKHNLSLQEMEEVGAHTLNDLFSSKESKECANEYCKMIHHKLLPILTSLLNEMHGLKMPETFWGAVFGHWLFRHICVVYEKYSYLSTIDIDKTSIKLIGRESFYIPNDHYDYARCFCNDFGVQQLVSQYYHLYSKGANQSISIKCAVMPEEQRLNPNRNLMIERRGTGSLIEHLASKLLMGVKKEMLLKRHNLKIVLCGVHYESDVMESIVKKSKSQIGQIHLPYVKNQRKQLRGEDRERLANINTNNPFERYLVDTLYYCMPKIMVEYFRNYYDAYLRDIQKKSFSHIVSEVWRSYFPTSIYVAIAQQEGKKLIFQQHGCSTQWTSCNPDWLEYSVADNYLTTGWVGDNKKIIRGGFACRNVRSYEYEKCKKDILYVGTNRLPYAYPFVGTANSSMINLFKIFRSFFELLPDRLRDHLLLRPRRAQYYCDTENIWSVKDNNIRTADGVFSDIIYESRIVIIDHLSTGLGEILSAGIPCMIIHDEHIEQLADEYFHIFDELKECGVVHNSALSAVNKLIEVYDDVEGWWKSEHLQNAHKEICGKTYGPASRTVDYLVSCIDS